MNTSILLQPRFMPPEGIEICFFENEKGKKIRYAHLGCKKAKAVLIYHAGLGQPLESDYENIRDFQSLGLTTYVLERYGENGSERMCKGRDFQKPPALHAKYFAEDLLFFSKKVVKEKLPQIFIGSCYGSLLGLTSCTIEDNHFQKMILAAPMFGSHFMDKNGGESYFAEMDITNKELQYWGKAQDWSWNLAMKLLENDPTTSDKERGALIHLWRKQNPSLQIGGFTFGRIKVTAQSVLDILKPDVLENVNTPVVIISGKLDSHNLVERHQVVADRLPNASLYDLVGAKHGLFRESDIWRDKVFGIIKYNI